MKYSPEALNDLPEFPISVGRRSYWNYQEFQSYDERKDALYNLCVESGALTEACMLDLIAQEFLITPASTKYHNNYAGGLFDHSYTVATVLLKLTKLMSLKWEDPQSPIRIGILHDLCKVDQYMWDMDSSSYKYRNDTLLTGHGTKSVILAQQLSDVHLTEEEIACIVYHMGAFTDKAEWAYYTNATQKYPNVLWVHTADMIASQILEV